MKQLVKNNKSGEVFIDDVPIPTVNAGEVLVKNHFSAISLGTEKSTISIAKSSLIQKAMKRPKDFKKVLNLMDKEGIFPAFNKATNKLQIPTPIGYSSAGEIIELGPGVRDFKIGDKVSCSGMGHAEFVKVPINLCAIVPEKVSLDHAAFATIGSIALQGIRQSHLQIGESIVVIGLGLIGQIAMQIIEASGCTAVGIDIDRKLVNELENRGYVCLDRNDPKVNERLLELTNGQGIDRTIIAASAPNNDPIIFSSEILRDRGTITVLGDVKMDLPRSLFYRKELSLNLARSYGPGRYDYKYEYEGHDYPIGYVRWTENRNINAVLELMRKGHIRMDEIINENIQFDNAPHFYEQILSGKIQGSGFVFQYDKDADNTKTLRLKRKLRAIPSSINLGLIGGGSYAQNYILPLLSEVKGLNLVNICTNKGDVSKHLAKKYNFASCTTDYQEIISNNDINCVFILTRHNTHSGIVSKCLNKDKHVYVEKPLALSSKELFSIKEAYDKSKGSLMVGFNRRFSNLVNKLKVSVDKRSGPISINYQVAPGHLPSNHWSQDLEIGGGRIIGEVCHFIDLSNYLVNSEVVDIKHTFMKNQDSTLRYSDNLALIISYSDGSISQISYLPNTDRGLPKERIELVSSSGTYQLDNFKTLRIFKNGRLNTISERNTDKGQKNMIREYFLSLIKSQSPIPFNQIFDVTNITHQLK
ncbi:MAG: oxidoreductase [Bdellovibrionaceae bacterium]|nr:oxidoreductase [Pseudobdellovibrionaceae bacterium]|tara:strand:- start:1671 stop:3773 length:2103 start_codon:yes stop_codon:yes gene_type:complete